MGRVRMLRTEEKISVGLRLEIENTDGVDWMFDDTHSDVTERNGYGM